ncbi:MAG: dynamin family protein [Magnetococcales bacterium]|nr:dynamin family protein [Magnetococcales bacterium]MBF0150050.1 dynamin family protein [Magnetococcales bacterium]MBF0629510.1 dynamin family protein [Magnetococcales bacterium]
MFDKTASQIDRRIASLEKHLKSENPVLLQVVQSFRDLDRVAYRMGLLERNESFATRVPWWPMVSILGTFSSGKSTFINSYLGQKIQRTGNQAVDDKFTVICFSREEKVRTLPGLALDADPRFPFYQISHEIEKVCQGEGQRIDSYLQLKTCLTEKLRGKILIDSPGFDADAQRTSTLRITNHMIDLSDLVLVFFDARHPEPGAMKDTLDHLVKDTINRSDANKFLFVLNQIDCTAQEDNLEDVVASWQRSLAQCGLTAGRFYQIYNRDAARSFPSDEVRDRFEAKSQEDLLEIEERMHRVEVERAYRIIGVLEYTARMIGTEIAPRLTTLLGQWRNRVLLQEAVIGGIAVAGAGWAIHHYSLPIQSWIDSGLWQSGEWWQSLLINLAAAAMGTLSLSIHYAIRRFNSRKILADIPRQTPQSDLHDLLMRGFSRNTRPLRSILLTHPSGWGGSVKRRLQKVLKETDRYVQNLNDQFANPSGKDNTPNPKVQLDVD